MRVLGIDCGLAITGWAVIEATSKAEIPKTIDYGVITTESTQELPERLADLYEEMYLILTEFKPGSVGVESLFYFKNQKTIMSVGQARGVTILAAAQRKLPIFDYTPLQVKQAVTGYGKATKDQMQRMVKNILKLDEIPRPDDAADALGVAICHINSNLHLKRNIKT